MFKQHLCLKIAVETLVNKMLSGAQNNLDVLRDRSCT